MKITWYGTASILIEIKNEKLLFDPFFRRNKKLEQPSLNCFTNVDYIFNTHPHFDHLIDVPRVLENTSAKIYGSYTMQKYLWRDGVKQEKTEILLPGDTLITQNATIKAVNGQHIKNNVGIILKTTLRIIGKFQYANALKILSVHKKYFMRGDIVGYFIKAEDKKILLFGSAGYDKNCVYPSDIDVLIWPFQGRTRLEKYSIEIIKRLNPKKVILDHFDNAFPPITNTINTIHLINQMKKHCPNIEVIAPKFNETIEI